MKKFLLVFFCTALLTRASDATLTATITEQTNLELMKGKGSIVLKKGTTVNVVNKDGETLEVVYRNIQGHVPVTKTDFKGEVPKDAVPKPESKPKSAIVVNSPAPTAAPVAKPADPKPAASASPLKTTAPQSMAGKMVKKAQDNAASHNENLVSPTNETVGGKK